MKRSMLGPSTALLAAVTVLVLVTASAGATTAVSLSGEFFSAGSTLVPGSTLVTSATCSQTSPSTISFTASGTVPAGYPYPGSFSESGFVTISNTPTGPSVDGLPLFQVTAVDTFFTITSPSGDVTGTEHLSGTEVVQGLCDTFDKEPFGTTGSTVTGFFRQLAPGFDGFGRSYDAIISTTDGTFEDTGIAGVSFTDLNVSVLFGNKVTNDNSFGDAFSSSGVTAISGIRDVTGGGQISPNGNRIAFGFVAKSQSGHASGQCDVVDKTAGVKLHCSDVTSFFQVSPTEVKFFGDATVNGSPTSYMIDTNDLADSGIGADTFTISTGTGYSATGTLTAGNVQNHTG